MKNIIDRRPEKVTVESTGNGPFQVRATVAGAQFFVDEPVSVGGLASGPTPYDLIATALASCTAMTLQLYARRKSWPLEHVAVNVEHRREYLNAKDDFRRELLLSGPLSEEQREHLLTIADRCPVHRTLAPGSDIQTTLVFAHQVQGPSVHQMHLIDMEESCADRGD
ncbi:OsmC family protein [Sphingomonas sp. BN140010]|uniref:OsmC family protein n=1 Tax=Sphingomonas arvum TaxID=2992113 RepID=A0ABT3JDV5_9SPHN|nr:OsmC family protein [Sphingomonas sp. BN140010]MCW3797221.1 OsmC family protein [Sphingomonas sp. BN140010]